MRRRDRMTSQPDSPAGLSFERDDGTMPCDGAWPAEHVALFQRWIASEPAP